MVAICQEQQGAVPIGAPVYSADGYKLGTLRRADLDEMVVQDGMIFVRTYVFPLNEADRYEDGCLILRHTKDHLISNGA